MAWVTPLPMTSPIQKTQGRRFGVAIAFVVLLILFTLALSIVLKPRGRDVPTELSSSESGHVVRGSPRLRRFAPPRGGRVRALSSSASCPYGEADAVITLFTEQLGKVAAMARGARKSKRRFAAALEPMHTVQVTLDERPGAELFGLARRHGRRAAYAHPRPSRSHERRR